VRLWWLPAAAVLALSCERPEYTYVPDLPINDGGATFGTGGAFFPAGSAPIGAAGDFPMGAAPSTGECLLDQPRPAPILAGQVVAQQLPARRRLFLQLTGEEVERLKTTGELIPPRPAAPLSPLVTLLTQLQMTATELRRPLLVELANRFRVTRAAWPNLWALRLVDHPSSERMNPVLLTLRKDAWVARIADGVPAVVDVNNAVVPLAAATAEPERIAAVYYVVDDLSPGGVATCESGKRELLIGNPDMVESFAIGTPEILTRLNADITALGALLEVARPCTTVGGTGLTFHAFTVCQSWRLFDASTDLLAYQWSLTNPVEAYKPTAQNLTTLIQALEGDRFEPQPFVGTPTSNGGMGGQGGAPAGGEGGAAGYAGAIGDGGLGGDGGTAGDASGP
jgi:hypothetical protein